MLRRLTDWLTISLPTVLFTTAAFNFFDIRTSKKCSEDYSFLTFSLPNGLFTTAACSFSTAERPKVLRRLQFFNIFTSKCAFRRSGVHFFDGWRAKSALGPVRCFVAFSLQNVLFATAACNFSTSELQKVLRSWRQSCSIFTSKSAFRHSGVQFLMSPLSSYLRTRRFNRPTFGLTRHTNHWKNTAFRDFSNIWRGCIFLSSDFRAIASSFCWLDYSTLLFNCPYCRKFLFKLPSISTHQFQP